MAFEGAPTPELEHTNATVETPVDTDAGLKEMLEERNIGFSTEKKEFSIEDREQVYNMAQEQLKKSRERFRQQENFVSPEQIEEVYNAALEQVARSIESGGRLKALQEKTALSTEELDAKLAEIETMRTGVVKELSPTTAEIANNMRRTHVAMERGIRSRVHVTPRAGL